jgi:hypothetical protein
VSRQRFSLILSATPSVITRLDNLNLPLKKNQNAIIQLLMTHRVNIFDLAHIIQNNPGATAKRLELLRSSEVRASLKDCL